MLKNRRIFAVEEYEVAGLEPAVFVAPPQFA
jgi:hypothetical protein